MKKLQNLCKKLKMKKIIKKKNEKNIWRFKIKNKKWNKKSLKIHPKSFYDDNNKKVEISILDVILDQKKLLYFYKMKMNNNKRQ